MTVRKQVMDMRSTTSGVSAQESDEQQRNWTKTQWEKKAKDSLSNYDPTRAKLNFEVVKGGIVQPIDTSKTIAQKMAENLAARGIKDPNARPGAVMKRRTVAQFIFGGNRERMHELAFGNQMVDLTKGANNSAITRCKDIEEWAKDVYGFMAKRFGEDNIISFYVHLDEKNPHIHCTKELLDDSGYTDLTSNGNHILNCAMLLALQYIEAATTYANSHGGGGSTNLSGWGRDKDEDDEHWWRRCIAQSAALMHPKGRKKGRGR